MSYMYSTCEGAFLVFRLVSTAQFTVEGATEPQEKATVITYVNSSPSLSLVHPLSLPSSIFPSLFHLSPSITPHLHPLSSALSIPELRTLLSAAMSRLNLDLTFHQSENEEVVSSDDTTTSYLLLCLLLIEIMSHCGPEVCVASVSLLPLPPPPPPCPLLHTYRDTLSLSLSVTHTHTHCHFRACIILRGLPLHCIIIRIWSQSGTPLWLQDLQL